MFVRFRFSHNKRRARQVYRGGQIASADRITSAQFFDVNRRVVVYLVIGQPAFVLRRYAIEVFTQQVWQATLVRACLFDFFAQLRRVLDCTQSRVGFLPCLFVPDFRVAVQLVNHCQQTVVSKSVGSRQHIRRFAVKLVV